MVLTNIRKQLIFIFYRISGFNVNYYINHYWDEDQRGIPSDTTRKLLIQFLSHCHEMVPYYRIIMDDYKKDYIDDPIKYLQGFPIMTKDIIRSNFDRLKSKDLNQRRWSYATSGGSTGEAIKIIADNDHCARASAVTHLFSKWIGKDLGESQLSLWASPRDTPIGIKSWKTQLINNLLNYQIIDACHMTSERMRKYISHINRKRPKIIISYADALYELACFSEREGLDIVPQNAIITSAGMLHPFMRQKIEEVFRCRVFNRYATREVGTIACERPEIDGLWVPPWTMFLEIVDNKGNPVPNGEEGEILVTSLSNYAMPLIRYKIGDRGVLSSKSDGNVFGQVLDNITGRENDIFKTRNGAIVHAAFFAYLLYFRDWIKQYQVIQKDNSTVLFRIVKAKSDYPQIELQDISNRTKDVMGEECKIDFEFIDEISASNSGKFRYIISEVSD